MIKLAEIKEDVAAATGLVIGFAVGCVFDSAFLSVDVFFGEKPFRLASSLDSAVIAGLVFGLVFSLFGFGVSYAIRAVWAGIKEKAQSADTVTREAK